MFAAGHVPAFGVGTHGVTVFAVEATHVLFPSETSRRLFSGPALRNA